MNLLPLFQDEDEAVVVDMSKGPTGAHGPTVRHSDPDTSLAAAERLEFTEVQARVLAIHKAHPERGLTDEELLRLYTDAYVTAESSPRKRRCDLARLGLIVDSGERRLLISGRRGIVWRLK